MQNRKRRTKKTEITVSRKAPAAVELLLDRGELVTIPEVVAEHEAFRAESRAVLARLVTETAQTVREGRRDLQAARATIGAAAI